MNIVEKMGSQQSTAATPTTTGVVIFGKIGSGKSALCSALTSPLKTSAGYRFVDDDIEYGYSAKELATTTSLYDTTGLVGNDAIDGPFLSILQKKLRAKCRLTGVILCMRFGTLKAADRAIIRSVMAFVDAQQQQQQRTEEPMEILVVVTGCPASGVDDLMKLEVSRACNGRNKVRTVHITALELTFSETRSWDGARYILATEKLQEFRAKVLDLVIPPKNDAKEDAKDAEQLPSTTTT